MNVRGASSLITAKPASVFARGLLFIFPALHWRVVHRSIRRVLSAGLRIHRSSGQWVAEQIYIASGHAGRSTLPWNKRCRWWRRTGTAHFSSVGFCRFSDPLLSWQKYKFACPMLLWLQSPKTRTFPHYRSHHRCTKHSVRQTCRTSIFEACFAGRSTIRYSFSSTFGKLLWHSLCCQRRWWNRTLTAWPQTTRPTHLARATSKLTSTRATMTMHDQQANDDSYHSPHGAAPEVSAI